LSKIKFKDYRSVEKEKKAQQNIDGLPPTSSKRTANHPKKPKHNEDVRVNYRIVRCCLNCKFNTTAGPNPVRSACTYPLSTTKVKEKLNWQGKGTKKFLALLTPTHATGLCNHHVITQASIRRANRYCGVEYLGEI